MGVNTKLVKDLDDTCPKCGTGLSQRRNQPPWCGSCEWNLEKWQPDSKLSYGRRRLSRISHESGYRLDAALFAAVVGKPPGRPGWTSARVILTVVSLVLVLLVAVCAGLGAWLVVDDFPSFWLLPGAVLLLLAWGLRPRFGRIKDDWGTITATEAPRLHALVKEVATSVGAPVPDRVVVDSDYNAAAGTFGLRRQRVLFLGLPLWGSLPAQQRVALLAHEFGHFVNNDPARSLATRPAVTVFGILADAFRPHPMITAQREIEPSVYVRLGYLIVKPVLWLVSNLFLVIHIGLTSLSLRDSHRAEYLADAASIRVAGTEATVGLQDSMLLGESTINALQAAELRPGANDRNWPAVAAATRAEHGAQLPLLRQLSLRDEASLFAGHPPSGYRIRLAESLPAARPAVLLSEQDAAVIDRELAKWYDRAGRDIVR